MDLLLTSLATLVIVYAFESVTDEIVTTDGAPGVPAWMLLIVAMVTALGLAAWTQATVEGAVLLGLAAAGGAGLLRLLSEVLSAARVSLLTPRRR